MQGILKRRGAAIFAGAAGVLVLVGVVLLATSAGGSGGTYQVRAIFDDADNLIGGEDVKVDGVKVGSVGTVTPTPQAKAAVVLEISNPGFRDFREDASCIIRPQSLIGEKFVDCLPTQQIAEGATPKPFLKVIPNGQEGAGQRLLGVQNNSSPVDTDLLNDITQRSEAERLRIILNELGVGLANRGSDIHEVVERADPALRETNKVLHILATENKVLSNLALEGDRAITPFAEVRKEVADFIAQSNTVAKASALHRSAIGRNFEDFPAFLEQFEPAMERLGKLADQTIPTFRNLNVAAPGIDKTFEKLGPFSKSSEKFFKSFGSTAKVSGPALKASEPLLNDIAAFGTTAKPFAGNFAQLLSSLRETGGLERIMDFIFVGAGASNGYDALGHFLRAEVLANQCETYSITPANGCSANFINRGPSTAKTASAKSSSIPNASTTSVVMDRTLDVLKGASPAQAIKAFPGKISRAGAISLSEAARLIGSNGGSAATPTAQPVGGSSAGTTYYTPAEESSGVGGALLNYLLGN
jgi:phospholipid/cholesterol/gamma-HCH transport system substrate-binding protein